MTATIPCGPDLPTVDGEPRQHPATEVGGVDAFLAAVARGEGIPPGLYAPDARLDAIVPGWRFGRRGPAAITSEYAGWFHHPAGFAELRRHRIDGGEVAAYLLTWEEGGVPHAAHHVHILMVDGDGRITSDTVSCGGRWDATLLAQMADADR